MGNMEATNTLCYKKRSKKTPTIFREKTTPRTFTSRWLFCTAKIRTLMEAARAVSVVLQFSVAGSAEQIHRRHTFSVSLHTRQCCPQLARCQHSRLHTLSKSSVKRYVATTHSPPPRPWARLYSHHHCTEPFSHRVEHYEEICVLDTAFEQVILFRSGSRS